MNTLTSDITNVPLDTLNAAGATSPLSPSAPWSAKESEHFVQFYEKDEFLLDSVSEFLAAGLQSGDACIIAATEAHAIGIESRLESIGIDVRACYERKQFVVLDAAATLSKFMVDGVPDQQRFDAVVGEVISEAARNWPKIRIFGEMVALLAADDNFAGSVKLERVWNVFHENHRFQLYCAYPIGQFTGEGYAESLAHICSEHSHVLPAESYSDVQSADARLRQITLLQQKATSFQAELLERKRAEAELLVVKDELEVQLDDLRRLHEMSIGLTSKLEIEWVLREVLRSALSMQGTNLGFLTLCDDSAQALKLRIHQGFSQEFLKVASTIPYGVGTCGKAYAERRQIVVEDVLKDPLTMPHASTCALGGFRAVHSTPLITNRGNILGVLTLHFAQPHLPTERQMRLMDLYARMAADIIESNQLHHEVQQKLAEREQLLRSEHDARERAEKANQLKDEFLATVSHELRTPLSAIIGWVELLRTGEHDDATLVHGLETIDRNSRSQALLIEDLLDVSRVVTGKFRLEVGTVDLFAVVEAALDSAQLAASSKNINVSFDRDPEAQFVAGDSGRLQQVVWNLLSNAIKFTPPEGSVAIKLSKQTGQLKLSFTDTGEGITAEFLPYVFDRFRQADGTKTRQHGGLGLGLSIVKHLIELHGGTVNATSEGQGKGTTIEISLPEPR